ncbi:MAG: hypothetical protein ACE5H1_00560 [Thermodesulfobacteriota bacterium]
MSSINQEGVDFSSDSNTLAVDIANKWDEWDSLRATWKQEKQEIREYIVATDTTKTSNSKLPWKNKTTLPKLTQIRDNLHANYMAALFPNDEWLTWVGFEQSAEVEEKRKSVLAYIKNKLNHSDFKRVISSLVYDYIDYGNAFGMIIYEENFKEDPDTGETLPQFIGPRLYRVSPFDIVFDPTSNSFDESPKIIRSLKRIGDIKKDIQNRPDLRFKEDVFNKIIKDRKSFANMSSSEQEKSSGYVADGFTSFQSYFSSGYVELLEFYGDLYDIENDIMYEDHIITVVDGKYLLRAEPNKSWLAQSPIKHIGWRIRSDNLWAMGPLDNLVGMQYRIDHLENLKADVFDMIAHPIIHVIGEAQNQIKWGPNEKWYSDIEGDIRIVHPDTTALNADFQIQELERRMEEFAGSPRETAGFRTPGEKTKYEVQVLERGAGRIFHSKTSRFESDFMESIINIMFEEARRNLNGADIVRVFEKDIGITSFLKITKEDITAEGKLVPMGARHFAEDSKFIQDISTFGGSIGQDPGIRPHWSGKKAAQRILDRMGASKLYKENIFVEEQLETQKLISRMGQQLEENQATPTEPQPEDFIEEDKPEDIPTNA